MTERDETDETWVQTENTQHYTPDHDPDSDEAWVQTHNTQQYTDDNFVETENTQHYDQLGQDG
jgi:hypothetical protein